MNSGDHQYCVIEPMAYAFDSPLLVTYMYESSPCRQGLGLVSCLNTCDTETAVHEFVEYTSIHVQSYSENGVTQYARSVTST